MADETDTELKTQIDALRAEIAELKAEKKQAPTSEKSDIANAIAKLAARLDRAEKALALEEEKTAPDDAAIDEIDFLIEE